MRDIDKTKEQLVYELEEMRRRLEELIEDRTTELKRTNKKVAREITERKKAEEKEKELQQELILNSRLATVGEMAAGIAHEINNPLTGVIGFSDLLMSSAKVVHI